MLEFIPVSNADLIITLTALVGCAYVVAAYLWPERQY